MSFSPCRSEVQNSALCRHHILVFIDIPCIKNKYCIQRYLELLESKKKYILEIIKNNIK